jgi:hypothetical protein
VPKEEIYYSETSWSSDLVFYHRTQEISEHKSVILSESFRGFPLFLQENSGTVEPPQMTSRPHAFRGRRSRIC